MTDNTSRYATSIPREDGEFTHISVTRDPDTDQVTIYGQDGWSICEHTWTQSEAETIFKGLSVVLNRPILDD